MIVLIDAGHGRGTPGKRSPSRKLMEWSYNREIARRVTIFLRAAGIDARQIVLEDVDVPLRERCRRVNEICSSEGKENVILVSIHVNAAGSDGKWHSATGWSAYTTKGKTKSDALAESLYDAARKYLQDRKIRTDRSDGDSDWEENFYLLRYTACPAVLTENFFMDNEDDVKFLLSEAGKDAITKVHCEGIVNYINYRNR